MAPGAPLHEQLQGMHLGNPQQDTRMQQDTHHYYPSVPQPAPGGYPSGAYGAGIAPGYPVQPPGSNGMAAPGHAPPQMGEGWTAESVQPAAAVPGKIGGHYGHLQHAPSFNTAAGTAASGTSAAAAAAVGGTSGQAPPNGWVLSAPLPQPPTAQLIGPHVRYNDYDPVTGLYEVSVLVVSHPSLINSTVQLHWAINGPAMTAAPSQVLDEYMGYRFYRFDISLQLTEAPGVVNYLVGLVGGQAPLASHSFHLPARSAPWRWVFYSCNGFHDDAMEAKYGGIGYLWNDLMGRHRQQPYHLQVGGGDQLYCDHVFELPTLKPWQPIPDPHERAKHPFTPEMLNEVEQFYFGHYCKHFSDAAFGPALASIPFHFSWDDHDIFDGWGSYPEYLQNSAVFQGMFAVARRFYLLFQQHCRYDNAVRISKTIGEFSYHAVRNIGPNAVLLSPDTRSERRRDQVAPPEAWDALFFEVQRRLSARPGAVHHLLLLLPVPIVYPKIPVTESVMAAWSSAVGNYKTFRDTIAKLNLPSTAVSAFNEPELLDDLLDHWTAAEHTNERQMLVRRLQDIASSYSVRVTFLSGDVHLGAFGCFQAHPKQHVRVLDPKYMLQVVSSAIGNEPPPPAVVGTLETSSMASTTMGDTLDKMIRTFPDKKRLRGARNYCEVQYLHARHCDTSGAAQPEGGLGFTLRFEQGTPGTPTGIDAYTQVAPVLLTGHKAAEAGPYSVATVTRASPSGMLASVLPGQHAEQLQQGMKTMGHKLANFLARV